MYFRTFEIRWSDVDANQHLRNSAYIDYMSHTRMSFLMENGLDYKSLAIHNLGPVAFYEQMFYFKEVFPGTPIRVSLELQGMSEDGMFFKFLHNFYDDKGKNVARCEMMGAWINMKTRKLTALPETFLNKFDSFNKSEDFKILTKEDTRKGNLVPNDLKI